MVKRRQMAEDRQFQKEFEDSLKVSSYAGQILEALQTGQEIQQGMVPDMGDGTNQSVSNEGQSLFSIDPGKNDHLFQTAAASLGISGLKTVSADASQAPQKTSPQAPQKPQLRLSQNQLRALKKYPSLVDFLGSEKGDQIAKNVVSQVNHILVKKIESNTKAVHKNVYAVEASGQNMKAYFMGKDNEWVCCVIASGPFRGDEVIFYKDAEDKSYILRKIGDDWTNVSDNFNVIHEFARQGD